MASGTAASSRSIALAISLLGGGRQGRVKSGSTPEKTAKKLRLLVDAGVDSIVDLTTPDDHLESYLEALQLIAENAGRQVRHYAHPIPDNSVIDHQG